MTTNNFSKRSALRFPGYDRHLTFKTDYEDGEAALVNISSSGCMIRNPSCKLQLNQKILLTIALDEADNAIQIQALVKREDMGNFGLHFRLTDDQLKQQLARFFAQEHRRRRDSSSPAT